MAEPRPLHSLHCSSKDCKDKLLKHVISFYHKDGHLDIEVQSFKNQQALVSGLEHKPSTSEDPAQFKNGDERFQFMYYQGGAAAVAKNGPRKKNVKNWHQIHITSVCNVCGFQPV